jgi:predicted transposase/invertase (TIGR01784 family)
VREEQTFRVELDRLEASEQEAIMQTMTSWEEKGMEKGIEKATQTIALNLLRQGLAIEAIAQATGLTIDQLQALQAQAEGS